MGLFFPDDDRSIPGVRKTGFPRYKEVLEANYKEFFLVGFLALVFHIPFGAGMVYAVGTRSALIALLAGLGGGLFAGPGLAGMEDLLLRRLRDDRADWWTAWKRAFRKDLLASLLPGALQYLLFGLVIFSGALILWGAAPVTPANLLLLLLSALLGTMLLTVWWPQVVLFEGGAVGQVKNAFFFTVFHFGKVLGAGLLQLLWWVILFLFLPWTAFVVPILGLWYIRFVALNLLYPLLNKEFHIEEQIEEAFPGRMDP